MRRLLIFVFVFVFLVMAGAVFAEDKIIITGYAAGQTLVSLEGTLYNSSDSQLIFDHTIVLKENKPLKVFTGAHTLTVTYTENKEKLNDGNHFIVDIVGLGPDYVKSKHEFDLATPTHSTTPEIDFKNGDKLKYEFGLLPFRRYELKTYHSLDSTDIWGNSVTVHYDTYWIKRSLIDFRWNAEMGYLENIYNRYRDSYKLTASEKIKTYFHPAKTYEVFINRDLNYGILPNDHRIDFIYNKETDGITTAAAAELLIYEQWGYGPRWMVTGFSGYYDDNRLQLRKNIETITSDKALEILKNCIGLDDEENRTFTGAFVFYLLQNYSIASFKNLYKNSTDLDFEEYFEEYYGKDLKIVLSEFIQHSRDFEPLTGELEYYASNYFKFGSLDRAKEYLEEIVANDSTHLENNLGTLATCNYWLGLYDDADKTYDTLLKTFGRNQKALVPKGDVQFALGNFGNGEKLYAEAYALGSTLGATRLADILIEKNELDSADVILSGLGNKGLSNVDYLLSLSTLEIMRGKNADSLLNVALGLSLERISKAAFDPTGHFNAGRSYFLTGDYEKAIEFFGMAWELEENPDHLGKTILELGKLKDVLGSRDEALRNYREVSKGNYGKHSKSLAEKYIKSPYKFKNN